MARTLMRFPGGRSKALTLSYDDGVIQDIRLIEIMKEHGLKGTFNLNSGQYAPEDKSLRTHKHRMSLSECRSAYLNSGMEIAAHGLTHPFLEQLPDVLCTQEILDDRKNLERDFECFVRGMAYPWGTYNDRVVSAAKSCGIVYARTTVATERFTIPNDWLRMPTTCHHNHPRLMELAEKFLLGNQFGQPYLFFLWGHSYEFDGNRNWNVIENFAKTTGNRDDVWYATNIELHDYVTAYNQLVFRADGTKVFNPTGITLHFATLAGTFTVEPNAVAEVRY